MSETFTVDVRYGIKYATSRPVPIPEIVASLESMARLLKRTPAFIEKAYGDIKVVETEIFVSKIESGSLIEDFIVRYVFKGIDNYEAAKAVADKIMSDNKTIHTIVSMGVGALMVFGVMQVIPDGKATPQLEAYNNTIINVGGELGFTAGDLKVLLDATSDKKALAKDAVQAFRPSKLDGDASIEIDGMDTLNVPSSAIFEVPEEYNPPVPDERETKYQNTEVVIYASDRDKSESGWAGIVPNLLDKRTAIILDAAVDPAKLHGRVRVRADIVIHERFVPSKKKYEARKIEIVLVN